jgi:hypothetical protein
MKRRCNSEGKPCRKKEKTGARFVAITEKPKAKTINCTCLRTLDWNDAKAAAGDDSEQRVIDASYVWQSLPARSLLQL